MRKKPDLQEIHDNLVNGNRRDAVKQIKIYGLYDFWYDYKVFLSDLYLNESSMYEYFSDMVISYFRITAR